MKFESLVLAKSCEVSNEVLRENLSPLSSHTITPPSHHNGLTVKTSILIQSAKNL